MTIEEADKADAYLKSISGIDDVTVYERTGDLIIYYSFDRSELIEILPHFSFENDEVKNIEIVGTARLVQREYYDNRFALFQKNILSFTFKNCTCLY